MTVAAFGTSPGTPRRMAVTEPPCETAAYDASRKVSPTMGDIPNVNGMRNASALTPLRPGKSPTRIPTGSASAMQVITAGSSSCPTADRNASSITVGFERLQELLEQNLVHVSEPLGGQAPQSVAHDLGELGGRLVRDGPLGLLTFGDDLGMGQDFAPYTPQVLELVGRHTGRSDDDPTEILDRQPEIQPPLAIRRELKHLVESRDLRAQLGTFTSDTGQHSGAPPL